MSNSIHKGTELNNVKETWERNEADRNNDQPRQINSEEKQLPTNLERLVREEAAAYDKEEKGDNILPGDRASVADDDASRQ